MNIQESLQKFVSENKREIWLYALLSIVYPLNQVVLPYFYGKALSSVTSNKNPMQPVFWIIAINVLVQLTFFQLNRLDSYMIPRLQSYVRSNIIESILKSYSTHYKELDTGKIVSLLIKLPNVIQNLAHHLRNFLIPTFLVVVGTLIYFFLVHWVLGVVALVGMGVLAMVISLSINDCKESSTEVDDQTGILYEEIADILGNLQTIYTSQMTDAELERIKIFQNRLDAKFTETFECSSKFKRIYYAAVEVLFSAIVFTSYQLHSRKIIDSESFSEIFMVAIYFTSHFSGIGSKLRGFIFDLGVLQKSQTYLDSLPKDTLKVDSQGGSLISGDAFQKSVISGDVVFRNVEPVNKTQYKDREISCRFPRGRLTAISGPVGTGKSTMIKCLLNLIPYTGTITIGDTDIQTLDPELLRANIAYSSQHPRLFNRSVYDNIRYGLPNISNADIDQLIASIPDVSSIFASTDLNAPAGKNSERLSGGQRQIVFLLSCILKNTQIIVLDEPTASLDPNTKKCVYRLISQLNTPTRIIVVITHDTDLLKLAKEHIVLS